MSEIQPDAPRLADPIRVELVNRFLRGQAIPDLARFYSVRTASVERCIREGFAQVLSMLPTPPDRAPESDL